VNVVNPGVLVDEWTVHILDTQGGVSLDGHAWNRDIGPWPIGAIIAHEEIQVNGLNADRQGDFQIQRRLQSQLD
jgi:hypothetical protein